MFSASDYSGLDDSTPNPLSLTEYQAAVLTSACIILLQRSRWKDMSDAQWDALETRIADAIDQLLAA